MDNGSTLSVLRVAAAKRLSSLYGLIWGFEAASMRASQIKTLKMGRK
jgi:hypothetical protein